MRLLFSDRAHWNFFLAAAQADPQLPLSPNADLGGPRCGRWSSQIAEALGGSELLARREARPRPKHQIANKNCAGWVLVVRARPGV